MGTIKSFAIQECTVYGHGKGKGLVQCTRGCSHLYYSIKIVYFQDMGFTEKQPESSFPKVKGSLPGLKGAVPKVQLFFALFFPEYGAV